jgi:GDPmannose 4,6-dehydratase
MKKRALITGITGQAPAVQVGDVIVRVDPRYFRPAEVETLLGDPSLAKADMGWVPKITLHQMVAEMMVSRER